MSLRRESQYDTWLMRPNQDRISEMFCGVGKSRIARICLSLGWILVGVMRKPANSTVSEPNTIFFGILNNSVSTADV